MVASSVLVEPPTLPERGAVSAQTLPQLLRERVRKTPHHRAYSDAAETVTWGEFSRRVDALTMALHERGLAPGDAVAVMGPTSGQWATADQAILAAGGLSVGVYSTLTPAQVAFLLNDCRARMAFAGSPAELAVLREARAYVPSLETLIGWNGAAEHADADYGRLIVAGAQSAVRHPDHVERLKSSRGPDDPALVVYTSGTTGQPKGAVLSHWNCVFEAKTVEPLLPAGLERDSTVSFLPMAHVAEHVASLFARINTGIGTYYVGSLESDQVLAALAKERPTLFGSVPRIFEKAYARIQGRVAAATPRRKAIFAWAEAVGRAYSRLLQNGQPPPLSMRVKHALADRLVFRKIRAAFGGRCTRFVSGAAPIDADILEFFHACGMLVVEGYGLTECTAIATINRHTDYRFGTVGRPIPGTEVRIADDGEILIRGPHVFLGYLNQEEATRAVLDDEGWLHSGDIGEIVDERYLRITDRKKNLIITSSGKNVAPAAIEALLTSEPILGPALIVGEGRPYLTALVTLDVPETRLAVGRANAAAEDLARDPGVRARVRAAFVRANAQLARYERVRRFRILDRELTIAGGELTPTLKLRRRIVSERFASEVASLYAPPSSDVIEVEGGPA